MIKYERNDFDGSLEDIMKSINGLLNSEFEVDEVKQVLFATTNPAKIENYARELEKNNIEL